MIIQGGVDSQGTQHTLSNAAKVWAITTGASNTTVTVPPIAENYGNYIDVMKADAGTGYVTVDGNGAETINGVANIVIEKQYCGLRLYGAASEWIVVGTIGECEIQTIGSAIELVYTWTKDFTTDGTSPDAFDHGIPDYDKVISGYAIGKSSASNYYPYAIFNTSSESFYLTLNSTQVSIVYSAAINSKRVCITLKYYI
jgi:hypothetical protein